MTVPCHWQLDEPDERGAQTPMTTTRGIASSLAASLDDAKADSKTGMRNQYKKSHNDISFTSHRKTCSRRSWGTASNPASATSISGSSRETRNSPPWCTGR